MPSELQAALANPSAIDRELARRSLRDFTPLVYGLVPATHHVRLCDRLEAVERGDIDRLMVFMPPGFAKSTYGSILFPGWYIGRNPDLSLIGASHTAKLAAKFGRRVRNLINHPNYREVFPGVELASDSKAADQWETTDGGEYFAVGVDGAVAGRRADLATIDDPIKGREDADSETQREKVWDWYTNDLYPRLKPGAAIILITTRWHDDDLAGRLIEQMKHGGDRWEILVLPAFAEVDDPLGRSPGEALWPEWYSLEEMERTRGVVGPRAWSALYQQQPSPEEGNYFKREWLRWYDEPPKHVQIYGASDYAVTADAGDYTVHGVIGVDPDDNIFVRDWWREQTESDVWIEVLLDLMERWKPLAWAEESSQIEKSIGPFLRKRMRERRVYCLRRPHTSSRDKPTRARSIQARMSMGKVYLPRNAPWVADLVSELMHFPVGTQDDQADTLSLFGRMLDRLIAGREPKEPKKLELRQPTLDEVLAMQPKTGGDKFPRI